MWQNLANCIIDRERVGFEASPVRETANTNRLKMKSHHLRLEAILDFRSFVRS